MERNVHKIIEEKPARKKCNCTWQNNTKMHLEETGCDDADWIQVAQDTIQWQPLVNTIMRLWVPQNACNSSVAE
jgi:hypothetical protein